MMNKYKVIYDFSFEEVIRHYQDYEPWDSHIDFYSLLHSLIPNAPIYNGSALNEHLPRLMNLLYSRYREHYCFSQESETISEDMIRKFFNKIVNVIVMTYERYAKILDVYEEEKDNLMNPVKTSTDYVNRYNDTPQDGGDFDDDEHTTNINHSKSETSSDASSKIARINEIEKAFSDVLANWSDEFSPLFIEED